MFLSAALVARDISGPFFKTEKKISARSLYIAWLLIPSTKSHSTLFLGCLHHQSTLQWHIEMLYS